MPTQSRAEPDDFSVLADALLPAALEAGRIIMSYFQTGVAVETKGDESPVTLADRRAEAVIVAALRRVAPEIPIVAEELASQGHLPSVDGDLFLVDPLDGTRGFIRGSEEFTVNIGLVRGGHPVFGIIYAPATQKLYLNTNADTAWSGVVPLDAADPSVAALGLARLQTRPLDDRRKLVVVSSRHVSKVLAETLDAMGVDRIDANSSLKFCMVAEGSADFYPRFGRISEWDTAAGAAILQAAGGCVTDYNGAPSRYGKSEDAFANHAFVAWSTPTPPAALLAELAKAHAKRIAQK